MGPRQPAIIVDSVSKKFQRGERHDSLRDLVPGVLRRVLGRTSNDNSNLSEGDFWAVRDVSFAVEPGEAVGLLGPNGAGKSTMLKLLNRILRPTRGSIMMRGRVAALIELAGGFHGDLTGRENIFLQGAMMGMRRREMLLKLDAIINFAGIEAFIDTPVKRYSSGMNARLGFAIAAHLDPDVLLIDEVLSVGDRSFQDKCVRRMKEFKRDGTAIVFVSHNMQAISELCDRAMLLRSTVEHYGPVIETIQHYLGANDLRTQMVGASINIDRVTLRDSHSNRPVTSANPGTPLVLTVECEATAELRDVMFRIRLARSTDDFILYDAFFRASELGAPVLVRGDRLLASFAMTPHLARGQYHFAVSVVNDVRSEYLCELSPTAMFQIDEQSTYAGVVELGVNAKLKVTPAAPVALLDERESTIDPSPITRPT